MELIYAIDLNLGIDTLRKLIHDNNVNYADKDGNTPLFYALNKFDVVKLLIEKGANVNSQNKNGNTPLMFTKNLEIIKLLIEQGANIHHQNNNEENVLFNLSRSEGNVEILEFFIKLGINVNHQNNQGTTALMWASLDQLDKVKLLVEHGADIYKQDNGGNTALIWATDYEVIDVITFLINNYNNGIYR